jgi:hypothetical protein
MFARDRSLQLRCALAVTLGTVACGARTGLPLDEERGATRENDAGLPDRNVDASLDGGVAADAASPRDSMPPCVGSVVVGDVFGNIVYFAGGNAFPAGHYRVTYVDGCMKYSSGQAWAVHAVETGTVSGTDGWWLVGDTAAATIAVPPGTVGYVIDAGGYATFDACVSANLSLPTVDFDFDGGSIGLWLEDVPYSDNVSGTDGRNPTWRLDCGD